MSKVVYKFPLKFYHDQQKIMIPKGSRILKVDEQDEVLTMWVLCDPSQPEEYVRLEVWGTGENLPELGRLEYRHHLDTVVMSFGLVWHVFQILKMSPKA